MPTTSIDVLLSENQIAGEFVTALTTRNIPEKFFYWFPTSVRAWVNLCSDGEYRNFVRSQSLVQKHAAEIISSMPEGPLDVISLGSGQGVKDVFVLAQARAQSRTPRYIPVDASQSLLEMACELAIKNGFSSHGVKADLASANHISLLHGMLSSRPRLVLLLGNTLGAFDPIRYCSVLAGILRPQDRLLVDGEIFSPSVTMKGYDNPLNRLFAFGPLRSVGLEDPRDGSLQFESDTDDRKPGLYRVRKYFRVARDLELFVAGEKIAFKTGDRVDMSSSYKYSRGAFLDVLQQAGISPRGRYVSDDERFLMVLGQKTS